jgi:hypothetical protein
VITAFASLEEARAAKIHDAEYFGSSQELAKLVASWPRNRPVEIWNSFAGIAPFTICEGAATPDLWWVFEIADAILRGREFVNALTHRSDCKRNQALRASLRTGRYPPPASAALTVALSACRGQPQRSA